MSSTFIAAQVAEYGKPLVIASLPKPTPTGSEVLVRLLVRPVNPADSLSIMGIYPGFRPASLPAVPGLEGMGVVEAVGDKVSVVKSGQRVVPINALGTFQEYIIVNQDTLLVLPDDVTDEAAAQVR